MSKIDIFIHLAFLRKHYIHGPWTKSTAYIMTKWPSILAEPRRFARVVQH